MENLKKELDDIINLEPNIKNTILNVYSSWNLCKNNHQMIENINNSVINFNSNYSINNNICDYDYEIINNKRTLYIDKCSDLYINIDTKFNHIVLINSKNINITINEGLITGIDILRSNNINLIIKFNKIPNINFGYSNDCKLILDKNTGSDICINTSYCVNINFILVNNGIISTHTTNKSLFSKINKYIFDNSMNLIIK